MQEPTTGVLSVRGVRRGAAALSAVAADGRDAGAVAGGDGAEDNNLEIVNSEAFLRWIVSLLVPL